MVDTVPTSPPPSDHPQGFSHMLNELSDLEGEERIQKQRVQAAELLKGRTNQKERAKKAREERLAKENEEATAKYTAEVRRLAEEEEEAKLDTLAEDDEQVHNVVLPELEEANAEDNEIARRMEMEFEKEEEPATVLQMTVQ